MIATAMIVDDSEVDRLLGRRVLERSDAVGRVECFDGGETALERLGDASAPSVDVVFLDIRMPRMDGFEVLDRLMEGRGPRSFAGLVVMLTTSCHPLDVDRARRHGLVADFLLKPLTGPAVERVDALLREDARPPTP